jgi:plastocyanin domain-containing protein
MNARILLLPFAAALALAGLPARAQHGGGMHMAAPASNTPIAEGVLKNGVRVVEMQVTGEGFVPSRIKVKKGEKVRLLITRKTDRTCATEIVIKDQGINTPLPLDKQVTVELTAKSSGEIKYACGMGHITGVIFVP